MNNIEENNILMEKCANEWIEQAKKLPNPRPLFGNIWHEGEVAILFSNTGKGKSILGIQIGDGISKGKSIINLDTITQSVIYFDFELSTKAFQRRYTDENEISYQFHEDFIRVEIDRNKILQSDDKSFEELIIESIKYHVEKSKSKVVIIDNITFLSASNEKSKEALSLMKLILELSRKSSIAILLIAHTPKRDIYKSIQLEDLAGSKALSNFTDVCFCIGESVKGSAIRYIKELKNRNYPIEYDENNVLECELIKENAFLKFKFLQLDAEINHLEKKQEKSVDNIDMILQLQDENLSNVEIGKRLGISESTVRRNVKKARSY